MQPSVSFVIPVYGKSPDVFAECLKSLHEQSLKDHEIIAVFDGVNAELQDVLKSFPKVKALVVPHGGAAKARNSGLDMATGKYVVFWDADCLIKPDAAKRWLQEFEAIPDADFIYTGYELSNEGGEFPSEPFDRYSLECGNYICSMSPIKREKALQWDESLEAAQDWDYWLTATENGLKGVFVEGPSFVTPAPDPSSISMKGLCGPNRDDLIKRIREKHGIPDRSIGVFSASYRAMGIKLARILGADFIKPQGYTPTVYKTVMNLGYSMMSRFDGFSPDTLKIQYWLPGEIEGVRDAKYGVVMETIRIAKGVKNLCGTDYEKSRLEEIGITAEVAPLPLSKEDYVKLAKDLPEEFTILVSVDKAYAELFKDLQIDLPHIKFKMNASLTKDYSCLLSFYQFAALDQSMLMAHVNGRNVISNVQAPYCGFVDPDQSWEKFKAQLYEKIREVKAKPFNKEAQEYYGTLAGPEAFVSKIRSYSAPQLEVLPV